MKVSVPVRILAVAAVLVLALIGLVAREGAARASGTEVVLRIDGFDPRALLTGHYVQFQTVALLPPGAKCPPGTEDERNLVQVLRGGARDGWVAFRPQAGGYAPAGAAKTREGAKALGPLTARGHATCFTPPAPAAAVEAVAAAAPRGTVTTPVEAPEPTRVSLSLGVDRFHAAQDEAEAMQAGLASGEPAYAVISIGDDGKARLKGVIIGGKRTNLDWF